MRIITEKTKNEIGKHLAAIYYISLHGYGNGTASDIDSMEKIIENIHEIANKVGGERFSNYEIPAYVWRLQKAVKKDKEENK